jgi:hypothetical protein
LRARCRGQQRERPLTALRCKQAWNSGNCEQVQAAHVNSVIISVKRLLVRVRHLSGVLKTLA